MSSIPKSCKTLRQLQKDGDLVMFHDYRSGSVIDLSVSGNNSAMRNGLLEITTTTSPQTLTVNSITISTGGSLRIHWGDGEYTDVSAGTTTNIAHTYSAAGEYNLDVQGTLDKITALDLHSQAIVGGDIGTFARLTNLTTLLMYSTGISGDISSLAGLTELEQLYLASTSVSGDISSLAGLTNLTILSMHSIGISGDISSLAGLTNLTTLSMKSTGISGDISSLAGLTNLAYLYIQLTGVSYPAASGAVLRWRNDSNIQIYSIAGMMSAVDGADRVDAFLIDLAASGITGGQLSAGGSNQARTSASDAAKATLVTNGWDPIGVNE